MFFSRAFSTTGLAERKALVDEAHPELSLVRQCELLNISRSSLYYQPVNPSDEALTILRLLDEQYMQTPFYGSRQMTVHLQQRGYSVNRKRVQRLMRQMGLYAVYPKPKLSRSHPEHKVYPYLLRGVEIAGANQVWSTDITYLPRAISFLNWITYLQDFRGYAIETLQAETVETRQCTSYVDLELNSPAYLPVLKGHFYLVAIMDWFSHKVLSWRISNTMDVQFCIEALEAALSRYHRPTIFNSDQGAQFTANAFTDCLKRSDIQTQ